MKNEWTEYWNDRISNDKEYYGKKAVNSDLIIFQLDIKKDDAVLDIGCGNGSHLSDIHKKTGASCFGIDISKEAVGLNKDKNISLGVGNMEHLPCSDETFEKVFSLGTLEHSPNTNKIFSELNRVMKLNGKAYVTVPNKISFFHIIKNIKMFFGLWTIGYEKSFTRKELRALCMRNGFSLEIFWTEPPTKIGYNPFNLVDKLLCEINPSKYGFFIGIIIKKIRHSTTERRKQNGRTI